MKELLRLFSGSALYTGCRYIFGIYLLSKIEGSHEKEYLSYTFIHANNQIFITLFINTFLVPLIEQKRINYFLLICVFCISSIISIIWPLLYGLELDLALLGMFVCITLCLYELSRRIIFSSLITELVRFDVLLSMASLITAVIAYIVTERVLLSILSFNITTLILLFKYSGHIASYLRGCIQIEVGENLKLNYGQSLNSLLAFIAGSFVFNVLYFQLSDDIMNTVNLYRFILLPVGLLLNVLDTYFTKYKLKLGLNIFAIAGFIFSLIYLILPKYEEILYAVPFLLVVPFQMWYRGLIIKLRQSDKQSYIILNSVLFTILSVVFVLFWTKNFPWYYSSSYLLATYSVLWIFVIIGKKLRISTSRELYF